MKRILILDDDERICEELKEYLDYLGYDVFCAKKPSEARVILHKELIDLLFLDLNLPETDGLSFLKEVKSKYIELEVIMISSSCSRSYQETAHHLGAFEYLCKPIHFSEISEAIKQINHTGGKS